MKEFSDILESLSGCYWILLIFPLVLVGVESHSEFPVHRLGHYELGGTPFGHKGASISLDARHYPSSSSGGGGDSNSGSSSGSNSGLLRKLVLIRLKDLSLSSYMDMVGAGIGGLLVITPGNSSEPSGVFSELESYWLKESTETQVPIFFAQENSELMGLLETLENESNDSSSSSGEPTALDLILRNVISSGFQFVSSVSAPKALSNDAITTLHSQLTGRGDEDSLPTILIAAHYDAGGVVPGLSSGADSNGSGVAILLELARLWNKLYSTSRTHPGYNLIFLLTGGGKLNYFGTRKWLEEHQDHDQMSEVLSNVAYVVCLDGLGKENKINMHVSKPPKDDTPASKFYKALQEIAQLQEFDLKVNMVHKKINLADDNLAWEHERFSIRRLPAFTLSHFDKFDEPMRNSILDTEVDPSVVARNARVIGEALACTIYGGAFPCTGQVFGESLNPTVDSVGPWLQFLTSGSRSASLLLNPTTSNKNSKDNLHPVVDTLKTALKSYTHSHNFKVYNAKKDKREPEFVFYDQATLVMSAYKVKPAMFDLVLTIVISGYLSLVYLVLLKMGSFISFCKGSYYSSSSAVKPDSDGNTKVKSN